ncbi:30S ribosomal protein S8 [Candidatus Gracilibacteria bacterium]|nr:30S ribosomal protein S8 [Candidatus Gracilibacteria bacterium]
MLTRIRNINMTGKKVVEGIPYSKLKLDILNVLKENGYIDSIKVNKEGQFKVLDITFGKKEILNLRKISKGGQRIYVKGADIKQVMNGYGMSIISTSKGVMAGYKAYKEGIGGELLCEIY